MEEPAIHSQDTDLLIRQSRDGDPAAFGLLMHRHQDYAFRLAYRLLGSGEESRDVVQESFIRVWRHLDRFRTGQRFTTWLYRIVVNLATDRLRQRRRGPAASVEIVNDPPAEELAIDEVLVQKEMADRVHALARRLPEKQRLVFVLRDLEDRSVEETTSILKMSRGSVKTHLYLARKAIREALEDDHV